MYSVKNSFGAKLFFSIMTGNTCFAYDAVDFIILDRGNVIVFLKIYFKYRASWQETSFNLSVEKFITISMNSLEIVLNVMQSGRLYRSISAKNSPETMRSHRGIREYSDKDFIFIITKLFGYTLHWSELCFLIVDSQ